MALRHLLQDLDKEADLHLSGLLQQSIQGRSSLGLAQDTEPLLDGTQLIFEILVKRSSCHLFQCSLILINVREPLLSRTVHRIFRVVLALRLLTEEDFR